MYTDPQRKHFIVEKNIVHDDVLYSIYIKSLDQKL